MLEHVDPSLLPLGVFFFFCSLVGCFGNFIMIFCSLVSKRLRSPCHFLISATCLVDAFHISGQFPFCYQLFAGTTASQSDCFFILSLPIVGYTAGGPLILAMGIDRFIAVKFPTSYRYHQQYPLQYICAQLAFPIVYTVFFLVFGFIERDTNTFNQMICANPVALNGASFQLYNYLNALLYVVVFILYSTVYSLLRSNRTSSGFKKVFRSIAVTVGFVLLGWAATTTANALSYSVIGNLKTARIIRMYSGVAVNIAAASNVFVFYAINSEYRVVIKSLFGSAKKGVIQHTDASTTEEAGHTRSTSRSKSISVLSTPKFVSSSPSSSRRMTLV